MSIAALVLGIFSFVISLIPIIGLVGIIPAITSIVLAIIDLVKKSKTKGISITGLILSGLALLIMIVYVVIASIMPLHFLDNNFSSLQSNSIFSNMIENNKTEDNNTSHNSNDQSDPIDINNENNIDIGNNVNSGNNFNNITNNNGNNTNTNNNSNNSTGNNNGWRNNVYAKNETATVDGLKVTCVSANTNFQGYHEYANIRSGYTVVKADFQFENTSTNNIYISFDDFDCHADAEDYDYFYSVDNATFAVSLPSGDTYQASVYFLVPSNSNRIVIEFEPNTLSDREIRFTIQ